MVQINKGVVTMHFVSKMTGLTYEMPDFQDLSYTIPLNDIPVISFKYPRNGQNAHLFFNFEIYNQVYLRIDGVEPPNHRFFLNQYEAELSTSNGVDALTPYAGLGVISRLKATLVYPGSSVSVGSVTGLLSTDRRIGGPSTSTNKPWNVIANLWNEAEARLAVNPANGTAVSPLFFLGNSTNDAGGFAWPAVAVERLVAVGTPVYSIIKSLADQGFFHFKMFSVALAMYATTNTTEFPTTASVIFRTTADITKAPLRSSVDESYSVVLFEGANKRVTQYNNGYSESTVYRRETYASDQSLISDWEIIKGASDLGNSLAEFSKVSRGLTYVLGQGSNNYVPGIDFDVGHPVTIDTQATPAAYYATYAANQIVKAYTVTVDDSSSKIKEVTVECVSRWDTAEEQTQTGVDKIEDGTTVINRGPIAVKGSSGQVTTSSTSFTDTGTAFTLDFTAPKSGKVLVILRVNSFSPTVSFLITGFRLSGPTSVAATDATSTYFYCDNGQADNRSFTEYVEGLTPGGVYTVTMQHRVTAGTGTFNLRTMSVVPLD